MFQKFYIAFSTMWSLHLLFDRFYFYSNEKQDELIDFTRDFRSTKNITLFLFNKVKNKIRNTKTNWWNVTKKDIFMAFINLFWSFFLSFLKEIF